MALLVACFGPAAAFAQAPAAPAAPVSAAPKAPLAAQANEKTAEQAAARLDDVKDRAAEGKNRKRPERDANTCLTCHLTLSDAKLRVVAEEYAHSVHRDERIGCVACHKGNPLDPTVQAHDQATGFVVKPAHQQMVNLCGGCHEDPTFVRRFNARLSVDQKRLFELSRHGKISAAGDAHSPTCSDCHGTHDIQPVASPTAPVNRRKVVELCSRCHADREYMLPYGISGTEPAKWKKSVHGKAFAEGNESAPACTGCHSPHAGTLPGTATVSALCDRCHQDERELFLKSPHARAFRKLGLPDCVPCHGDHDVAKTSWLAGMAPDSACSTCHSQDQRPREVAQDVARLLGDVEADEHGVQVAIADARALGLFMPSAQFALDRLHTARVRLIATVHTLDLPRLQEDAAQAKAIAAEAHEQVKAARQERAMERRGYYVAIGLASVLFVLLVLKAAQVARRRSPGGP
jgi:predicted CXXCH cytochrome family protein